MTEKTKRPEEFLTLGIETSCDETSASVLQDRAIIRSNIISSQHATHSPYGGVVPELASRDHVNNVDYIVKSALKKAGTTARSIDLIAVTTSPGLAGALMVGAAYAKSMAWSLGIPAVNVNHIYAHAVSALLVKDVPFPFLSLVISGGHTLILKVEDVDSISVLGRTLDDAAGESFDKVAKLMGLPFPGGPSIDQAARQGRTGRWSFPRMMRKYPFDFSFSGIKTAVMYALFGTGNTGPGNRSLSTETINAMAADFETAVVDNLEEKVRNAIVHCGIPRLCVGGGVARNTLFRKRMEMLRLEGVDVTVPPSSLCSDNAAMIALYGYMLHSAEISQAANQYAVSVNPSFAVKS